MDPQAVFYKTKKGRAEIDRRGRELSARQRRLLIMVDGTRPLQILAEQCGNPDGFEDDLRSLWNGGFIEANGVDSGAAAEDPGPNGGLKTALVRRAYDMLGDPGQGAVKKLRQAADEPEALRKALTDARKLVRLTIDEAKAEALYAEGMELIKRAGDSQP